MKKILFYLIITTIISCQQKPKQVNETVKTPTEANNPVIDSSDTHQENIHKFDSKYTFDSFRVSPFDGKPANPDFKGNEFSKDSEYVKFITEGCKENGINFGGHYTIIEKSCGAMCEHVFIVNRINGKIYTSIQPNDGRYGYLYKKDSKLLIANSSTFTDDSLKNYCDIFGKPEVYVWDNDNFKLLE